ncbi:MAG: hypothetical protein QOK35_2127 [Pseudonocardiales bacterium]|nr:hypothetical protein [Pseudonocardiales bacterium]
MTHPCAHGVLAAGRPTFLRRRDRRLRALRVSDRRERASTALETTVDARKRRSRSRQGCPARPRSRARCSRRPTRARPYRTDDGSVGPGCGPGGPADPSERDTAAPGAATTSRPPAARPGDRSGRDVSAERAASVSRSPSVRPPDRFGGDLSADRTAVVSRPRTVGLGKRSEACPIVTAAVGRCRNHMTDAAPTPRSQDERAWPRPAFRAAARQQRENGGTAS